MTPDENYFPGNRENLQQPIQMKLSEKLKVFSELFAAFLKSKLNFKHSGKKDGSHRLCVFETRDCKIHLYVNV